MPEVAFDESGNTGADLLNQHQPVFALASTCLSCEQANLILESLSTPQTREIKFSRLRRTGAGRRRIIEFLSCSSFGPANVITTLYHKKYMVVTKVVDLLVENLAYEDGIDLYRDGANIAMSNYFYFCMPKFCGEGRTTNFLRRFVEMLRFRTSRNIRRFYVAARTMYENSTDRKFAESLAPILVSERMIDFILEHNDRNSLDPAIPAFVQHCSFWGDLFGNEYDLIHDDSKSIFQQKETLEAFMLPDEEVHVLGYDRRKFSFPLRASGIRFASSSEDPRLQVADILASASSYWASGLVAPPSHMEFWSDLNEANLARFVRNVIWPSPDVAPKDLGTEFTGGTNPVDGVTAFMIRHKNAT